MAYDRASDLPLPLHQNLLCFEDKLAVIIVLFLPLPFLRGILPLSPNLSARLVVEILPFSNSSTTLRPVQRYSVFFSYHFRIVS